MKIINAVLVHRDGLTTTFQADGWKEFAQRVLKCAERDDARRPIERVFGSSGGHLEEHSFASLREDLAAGRLDDVDTDDPPVAVKADRLSMALADRAARALDRTLPVAERGPKTLQARALVAAWLDDGSGSGAKVRRAVAWLESVSLDPA